MHPNLWVYSCTLYNLLFALPSVGVYSQQQTLYFISVKSAKLKVANEIYVYTELVIYQNKRRYYYTADQSRMKRRTLIGSLRCLNFANQSAHMDRSRINFGECLFESLYESKKSLLTRNAQLLGAQLLRMNNANAAIYQQSFKETNISRFRFFFLASLFSLPAARSINLQKRNSTTISPKGAEQASSTTYIKRK